MERELRVAFPPVAGQSCAHVFTVWGYVQDEERYHHEEGARDADICSSHAVLDWGSGPQMTLHQPLMCAHILLVFGARLLFHQRHILPKGHGLSIQAFDWERLDELP